MELMLCSIVYSCYTLRQKFIDCDIFYRFLVDDYKEIELNYFLFVRAIIEKDCLGKFFDRATGKCRDVRNFYISKQNINSVLERVFGYGKSIKINRFLSKLVQKLPDFNREEKMHVYQFLQFSLTDYVNCRKFGENYKEEDEINKQILLEIHGDGIEEGLKIARKGYFPQRDPIQARVRASSVAKEKKGYISTELPGEGEGLTPKTQGRSSSLKQFSSPQLKR